MISLFQTIWNNCKDFLTSRYNVLMLLHSFGYVHEWKNFLVQPPLLEHLLFNDLFRYLSMYQSLGCGFWKTRVNSPFQLKSSEVFKRHFPADYCLFLRTVIIVSFPVTLLGYEPTQIFPLLWHPLVYSNIHEHFPFQIIAFRVRKDRLVFVFHASANLPVDLLVFRSMFVFYRRRCLRGWEHF